MTLGRLGRLMKTPESPILLRGEIWVSPHVMAEAGFDQTPKGLVDFSSSLGADICFFHWPESLMTADLKEMLELAHAAGLDCALTLDGPFQRLTLTRNVLDMLQELRRDPSRFRNQLAKEMEEISEILGLVKESEIELIVVTEDLAYTGGLYFSPKAFQELLLPLYRTLVRQLSSTQISLGWHSDGDVLPLLPDLVSCGFRFFSLEPECIDLLNFKRNYGPLVTLIGGIRAAWLAGKELGREQQIQCLEEMNALVREGGLILASSCGLYSPTFLPVLRQLYRLAKGIGVTLQKV